MWSDFHYPSRWLAAGGSAWSAVGLISVVQSSGTLLGGAFVSGERRGEEGFFFMQNSE